MSENSEVILAIDHGLNNIGLAYSRSGFVGTLPALKGAKATSLEVIKVAKEYQATKLLVGEPEERQRKVVLSFTEELRQQFTGDIVLWNEVLTTNQAKALAREQNLAVAKANLDSLAAAIMLNEYLNCC